MTGLVHEADPDVAGPGFYRGWPVAYIDYPVNAGDEHTYGGTIGLDFARAFGAEGRIDARAALSLAEGRVRDGNADGTSRDIPVGGMAPVQIRLGVDVRHGPWTVAPRVAMTGRQRLRATDTTGDSVVRRTLDGYSTVDVNIRRRDVVRHLDLFVTIENALDTRYRHINMRAYTNPEELIGSPQNPRRITVGAQIRIL